MDGLLGRWQAMAHGAREAIFGAGPPSRGRAYVEPYPPPAGGRAARRSAVRAELAGLGWLVLGLFLFGVLAGAAAIAVAGGDPTGAQREGVRGPLGAVGGFVASALLTAVGWSGAVFVCAAPIAHALRFFGRLGAREDRDWLLLLGGCSLLLPVASGLAAGATNARNPVSGVWGGFVAYYTAQAFGLAGAWLLLAFAACGLLVGTLAWNPVRALLAGRPGPNETSGLDPARGDVLDGAAGQFAAGAAPAARRRRRGAAGGDLPLDLARALEPAPEEMPAADPVMLAAAAKVGDSAAGPLGLAAHGTGTDAERGGRKKARPAGPAAEPVLDRILADSAAEAAAEAAGDGAEELVERPPRELLDLAPPRNPDVGRRELDAAGVRLEEVLRTFRIDGQVTGTDRRADGHAVRVHAGGGRQGAPDRVARRRPGARDAGGEHPDRRADPGKGAVGIEVPNATREMVGSRAGREPRVPGREGGAPRRAGQGPRGATGGGGPREDAAPPDRRRDGAGKSVCVNTIITSLIYRHTPATLRFLMVDPKMVELSVYNDLPHMRHKVITDSRDAASVLKWAIMEMEERYALLSENGCRNLQDFNRRVRQHAGGEGPPLKAKVPSDVGFSYNEYTRGELPYVVVVIDEMADLMMTVQGEVETPIARLAQKARAIGIHLIIATQRPSVNVITGLIKANFPSRIAFRVASGVDSKTILDGVGAEALLGNGDLLFIPPGQSEPSRLQGAYLSSEETERLMGWYRDRAEGTSAAGRALAAGVDAELTARPAPVEEDILEVVKRREALEAGQGGDDDAAADVGDRDKLFYEAAEACIQHQGGSTSLLQRRLKIGYGRAARIIDQLHLAGVLGPPDGSKPRDVLVGIEDLHRLGGPDHP
jgi:S-DNA-T family DNA segregation ATPase FtsK/SpoIIIE